MAYIRRCDVCGRDFDEDDMMHQLRSGKELGEGFVLNLDFCNDCGSTLPEPFQRALADEERKGRKQARKWAQERAEAEERE